MQQCPFAKRAFTIEYRISDPGPDSNAIPNSFPAGLMDVVAGYVYLVDVVGFEPENIIVVGDSAGGNLALAFARYLVDHIAELSATVKTLGPLPPSYPLVLLSPWCDLGTSHESPASSLVTNTYDFLPDVRRGLLFEVRKVYAGLLGMEGASVNPYLSPASTHSAMDGPSFKGFPPTFISAGGMERFVDQCRTLAKKMAADLGEDRVVYVEEPDACHDVLVLPFEQRNDTMKALALWLA
ncbi:hypothetical protein SCP_0310690 [Sparassis crispa]|uniref:Alpha/beta hydrolase fold-3 domain-containing protein n=1 Tax=Sparassis crispa TaxID=139825 RepID=A0A401GGQ1_9APHY|nr:hypothetical protein SCP_0310690 [Sparassis crispa]GBE81342.1 hypothetical protein SCP_0310690 [Sparassis crispa]